jgi:hypothetical protein
MSKMRICVLATVAAIGFCGTFGASATPVNGNLIGAMPAPAPVLQKARYYHRHARRVYRRAYRRGYYYGGGYYGYPYGYYGVPRYGYRYW